MCWRTLACSTSLLLDCHGLRPKDTVSLNENQFTHVVYYLDFETVVCLACGAFYAWVVGTDNHFDAVQETWFDFTSMYELGGCIFDVEVYCSVIYLCRNDKFHSLEQA